MSPSAGTGRILPAVMKRVIGHRDILAMDTESMSVFNAEAPPPGCVFLPYLWDPQPDSHRAGFTKSKIISLFILMEKN